MIPERLRSQQMPPDELYAILQEAFDSGSPDRASVALDAWEAVQVRTQHTLSFLRYYRSQLGQLGTAVIVCKEMLTDHARTAPERMCDYLELAKLYIRQQELDLAWAALNNVLSWSDLPNWYTVGMARDAIEYALDICIAARPGSTLRNESFSIAVRLVDDGSSTSYNILEKAVLCASALGNDELLGRFSLLAADELARIQLELNGK